MSDFVPVAEQIDRVERAVLRENEQMRYYLFTSVSTEDDREKQQLHLYVYGQDQEGHVQASFFLKLAYNYTCQYILIYHSA